MRLDLNTRLYFPPNIITSGESYVPKLLLLVLKLLFIYSVCEVGISEVIHAKAQL